MKAFVIYTMLFGIPMPLHDDARFTNMSACQIYLHTHYDEKIQEAFKVYCEDVTPPMCQGQPCQ